MRWTVAAGLAAGRLLAATAAVAALPAPSTGAPAHAALPQPSPRILELGAPDGVVLKATYYGAGRPGPGVLLFHQSNRTRAAWADLAGRLAAAGINTLTVDMRGFGDSGGVYDKWTRAAPGHEKTWPGDIELAWRYLAAQPGVSRDAIGVGGAGVDGVDNAVQAARGHAAETRSLVLISGETFQDGLQFLAEASNLPELFVVADGDEYPPTVEAMELLYVTASSPARRLIRYSASRDAPWLWYEPIDAGKVPATGNHGVDLFGTHPELPQQIVDWFVATLVEPPGAAPVNTVASAPIVRQIRAPGGVAEAERQLIEARRTDPHAQLWPEIPVNILGEDHLRVGEPKPAIEILKLNVLAYPQSANANSSLADAYMADGQKDLARQYAEKALAQLDSHTAPAASWTDTEPFRSELRRSIVGLLKKLEATR
jgi:dienelactone hydrolase